MHIIYTVLGWVVYFLIIFDFDGVLYDTQKILIEIYNKTYGDKLKVADLKNYQLDECFKGKKLERLEEILRSSELYSCKRKIDKKVRDIVAELSMSTKIKVCSICYSKVNAFHKKRIINNGIGRYIVGIDFIIMSSINMIEMLTPVDRVIYTNTYKYALDEYDNEYNYIVEDCVCNFKNIRNATKIVISKPWNIDDDCTDIIRIKSMSELINVFNASRETHENKIKEKFAIQNIV